MSKTILVTGATDGLGRGIVKALAARGDAVLVHGRDRVRAEALKMELLADGASEVRVYIADLASLADVRGMASEVLAAESRLDVLVCNAGIGTTVPTPDRAESKDGLELRFAVNYLSHYLLTRMLLPLLEKSAPARIVNVSSAGQAAVDFDDPMLTRGYTGVRAYCQSKLAQILDTITLAEALKDKEVTVTALHPSTYMATKIVPNPISTLEPGIEATMRLIVGDDVAGVTGRYFDVQRETRANAQAYDAEARVKLHALSRELTGV